MWSGLSSSIFLSESSVEKLAESVKKLKWKTETEKEEEEEEKHKVSKDYILLITLHVLITK